MSALTIPLNHVLAQTLKGLGHFVYFPNPGNLGDELIAVATVQVFDSLGLSYEIYDKNKTYSDKFTLVYGGGGGMIPDWGFLPTIEKALMNPALVRGVILPHSIRGCDELLKKLDERFTIFCRERKSLEYCRSINKTADIHLADDMGCLLNPAAVPSQKELHKELPKPGLFIWLYSLLFESRKSRTRILHRYYQKTYARLNRHTRARAQLLPNGKKLGIMIRKDSETLEGSVPPQLPVQHNIDVSRYGGADCCWLTFNNMGTRQFLNTIDKFDIIVTNRLHISIAAAHLGKEVIMIDNSYGKLSGVWEQSLTTAKHCHLCRSSEEVISILDKLSS